MVKVIFDMDAPFILNNEMVIKEPVEVLWWVGVDMVVDLLYEKFLINLVDDEFSIEITPDLFLVRKQKVTNIENPSIPILFLSRAQKGEFESARELLSFDITDVGIRDWLGEFEVIVDNHLNNPFIYSILPKGSRKTRNLTFEVTDKKITNIS